MTDPLTYRTQRLDPLIQDTPFAYASGATMTRVVFNGKLWLGGNFADINSTGMDRLVVWDGENFTQPFDALPIGSTTDSGRVGHLRVLDVGNGPELFVITQFVPTSPSSAIRIRLFRYDEAGETWDQVGSHVIAGSANTNHQWEVEYFPTNGQYYMWNSGQSPSLYFFNGTEWAIHPHSPSGSGRQMNSARAVGNRLYLNGRDPTEWRFAYLDASDDLHVIFDDSVDISVSYGEVFNEKLYLAINSGSWVYGGVETTVDDHSIFEFNIDAGFTLIGSWVGQPMSISTGGRRALQTGVLNDEPVLLAPRHELSWDEANPRLILIRTDNSFIEFFAHPDESLPSTTASTGAVMFNGAWWGDYPAPLPESFEIDISDIRFLPFTYTPLEEQLRVLVNGAEAEWTEQGGIVTVLDTDFGVAAVAFRETRSNLSWVQFAGASHIRRTADMMTYFNQRLFILQELCEMQEISELIGHPIPSSLFPEQDDSAYSVQAEGQIVDTNNLPFPLINDPIVRPDKQLTVIGVVGDLEIPFEFNPDHETVSGTQWGIDGDGLIVVDDGWNVEGWPIKVKRNTRLDRYWHSVRDASSFPSTPLIQMSRQLKFLIEESCGLPDLPDDHPLNNTIFPRGLNWLNYVGPGPAFYFGHMPWAGVFDIFVFVNNVLLEDTDWSFDWEGWNIIIPNLGPNDTVTFGPGGFGSISPGGLSFPNSDADETETTIPSPIPEGQSAFGNCCAPDTPTVSVADDGTITITGIICPCTEEEEEKEPPAIFSGVSFTFQNFTPGWAGPDDDPGNAYGPGGFVTGKASGLRWTAPNGDEWVEFYRVRDCEDNAPGVGRRRRNWTYSRTAGGDWTRSHTLTPCVTAGTQPGWVTAAKAWYLNEENVSPQHPIAQVVKQIDDSTFGSLEEQTVDSKILQAWMDALDFADPDAADVTLNQFLEWYHGGPPSQSQEDDDE